MVAEKDFRFLTMEEFNRLTRREKTVYLEQAAATIVQTGASAGSSLFKDAPPLPNAAQDPLAKKPA